MSRMSSSMLDYMKYRCNDKEDFYTLEKMARQMGDELDAIRNELEFHQRKTSFLLVFLQEIEAHPSLWKEWKRFSVLYKTITGIEPPLNLP